MLKNLFSQPKRHQNLEKQILKLLKERLQPKQIFEQIKDQPNFEQVSRFLYNSGLDKTLLSFSIQRLKEHKPVAWAYVIRLLLKYKIKPSKQLEKLVFHNWLKHPKNQSTALFACKDWGDLSPEFRELRSVHIQELEKKNLSEERDLLEQLEFVQAQNFIKEEEEIIKRLLAINPENSKYKKLKSHLEEKKAILIIEEEKRLMHKQERSMVGNTVPLPSVESHPLNNNWLESIASIAETHPQYTKDLALFLYFCHSPYKALEILEIHISRMSDYWFYLDWILETKQYTKGLDLIEHLVTEIKESESLFLPLTYIKAQMLYALGKKSEAKEHLLTISQIQSDYKSTQYFLNHWFKKEDEH